MGKVLNTGYYDLLQRFKGYNAQDTLVLWTQMSPSAPTDRTETAGTTLIYEGSPTTQLFTLPPAGKTYESVTFSDSAGQNGKVTNTSGLFCFTSLADGGTPTATSDRPFTLSMWVKLDDATTTNYFFTKRAQAHPWFEYSCHMTSGRFYFQLGDSNAGSWVYIYSANIGPSGTGQIQSETWTHLVFTYDGRGGSSPNNGMTGYVNGQKVIPALGTSGVYVGMQPDYTDYLYVGAAYGGHAEMDGQMAEFAAWSTELSATEVNTIYNASLYGMDKLLSGFLNNPPRTILRVRDNATGSYPTVSRIGDPGRTGRYATSFNDTNTVVFSDDVTVSYPMDLQSADAAYISQSIASPNTNATIEATGTVRKGVADANITFTPGEDLRPFVEDGLYASTKDAFTDPFYMTGSAVADVGLGFTSPLRSKTKIEIDLTPRISSQIFGYIKQGTDFGGGPPDPEDPNIFPMVYFNFDNSCFERIGLGLGSMLVHASTAPPANGIRNSYERSGTIGFTRGLEMLIEKPEMQCRPTTSFGFPSHSRYHATSSFLYPLSGVLDRTFLVEKMVYHFSASQGLGTDTGNVARPYLFRKSGTAITDQTDGGDDPIGQAAITSFFILTQREPMDTSVTVANNLNYNFDPTATSMQLVQNTPVVITIPDTMQPNVSATPIVANTYRDMVTYAQMVRYQIDPANEAAVGFSLAEAINDLGLGREINVNGTFDFTGSLVMSGTIKTTPRYDSGPAYRQAKYYTSYNNNNLYYGNTSHPGGRSGISLSDDRSYVAGTAGAEVSGTFYDFGDAPSGLGTSNNFNFPAFVDFDIPSPYLLKPTDNLIFGWQSPMTWDFWRAANGGTGPNMQIHPGAGMLTLYGCLVTDGHEHEVSLNQPLTSDAVHEFIGFHGPPLDQFDTEPRQQYQGGIFSNFITGSIGVTGSASSVNVGHFAMEPTPRGVAGQRATSQWTGGQFTRFGLTFGGSDPIDNMNDARRTPGAFRRFSSLASDEIVYDSFTPDLLGMWSANGTEPIVETGQYLIGIGSQHLTNPSFEDWRKVFPFEPKFSSVARMLTVKMTKNGNRVVPRWYIGGSAFGINVNAESGMWVYVPSAATTNSIKLFLFGTGESAYPDNVPLGGGPPTWPFTTGDPELQAYAFVRGFKYGLYHSTQQATQCKFRNSRYGQFRDMLEQRLDTRFARTGTGRRTVTSSPVSARFVSLDGTSTAPYKTSSSNMSNFVTSSLPYFDGVARNRGPIVPAELGMTVVGV